MTQFTLPTTAFVAVPTLPGIQLVAPLTPGVVAPVVDPAAALTTVTAIQASIAADTLANTAGNTAAGPSNNFHFTDLTVNVSGDIPGDLFKGATAVPDIKFQFLDLTPDTLNITAVTPNVFIKTDGGNDVVSAAGGRNILSVGGGINTTVGAAGHDTSIADTAGGLTFLSLLNFGSGDDAVLTGVDATNYTFTLTNSLFGLEIDANPNVGVIGKNAGELLLQGYSTADIGGRLSLGVSAAADGTSFLFLHAA